MQLKNATKAYHMKDQTVMALDHVNVTIDEKKGGFYVIKGHSGSGKTTLIQILGLLDDLEEGEYIIDGISSKNLSSNVKADLRREKIGFVFQDYYLNAYLNALENVKLPMFPNKKMTSKERKEKAISLLQQVHLSDRIHHYPKELSGGEQQRVSIARALANDPDVILADEPTGNLDKENEKIIFEMLKKISQSGKCVIVVSHNDSILEYADTVYEMEHGKLEKIA